MTLQDTRRTISRNILGATALVCAGQLAACEEPSAGEASLECADPLDCKEDESEPALEEQQDAVDAVGEVAAATPGSLGPLPKVCPAGRVITERATPGTCNVNIASTASGVAQHGHWKGVHLFTNEDGSVEGVPEALTRFCEFTWDKKLGTQLPDLTAFDGTVHKGAASDCEVVWPMSDVLSDGLAEPLMDAFYGHLNRLDVLPAGNQANVRIVVADTASNAPVEMHSKHARYVGSVINAVACPTGAACPRTIERSLAMPRLEGGVIDPDNGGFHGSQGDVARSIYRAIDLWAGSPSRLIVTMAFGWEPNAFGGGQLPAQLPGPSRAVYRALQHLACSGGLAIAAAGNVGGDTCIDPPGPLAPGLWQKWTGLNDATCDALFGNASMTRPADLAVRPLVHAVGGVAYDNKDLQNTRPAGQPRLVAPAFLAVSDGFGAPTVALSGTSMAAAAATGVASLVWSYRPTLTPGQVMDALYNTGASLARPATFGNGTVRRIDACAAVASVTVNPLNCGPAAADVGALEQATDDHIADLELQGLVDDELEPVMGESAECEAICIDMVRYPLEGSNEPVCKASAIGHATRYTSPQPEDPDCPVCFISDKTVHMTLAKEVIGDVEVVLELTDGVAAPVRFNLGWMGLSTARVTRVPLPEAAANISISRATLHMSRVGGEVQSNAIAVR